MDKGNLQDFVQIGKWTTDELTEMARQSAAGMAYLADQKIVHR